MRDSLKLMLGLGLALGAVGCGDYFSGPGLSEDPNNVTRLTKPGPLYINIQQAVTHEGGTEILYMQHLAGIARGAKQGDSYIGSSSGGFFGYGGGGLLDIHKMEQLARKIGDSLYVGLAKVYEALDIGFIADLWGDIPYREAADSTILHPHFDPQLQVYSDVQIQLDSAINIFLAARGPSNVGGALDNSELTYTGRDPAGLRTVYTAVARSLKARLFMHVAAASVAGVNGAPSAAYDSALKYARAGISSGVDDFLWFHDASLTRANTWWGYVSTGDFGPGAAIIEILNRRIAAGVEDTRRISFYFTPASDGQYHGFRPTGATVATSNGTYDGSGPYSNFGAFLDPSLSDGSFRQPELTYAETQLVAAEASWHLSCAGCLPTTVVPAAQPFLDAARKNRRYGSAMFGTAPGTLPASLQNIIEEKYVTLFLNPEVWSDWRRTCLPSLAPAPGTAAIPARIGYGEITTNPNAPAQTSRLNPNQPTACPVLNYTNSSPLAN